MSADVAGRDMLGTRTSRICDFYLRVCIFITMLQGASPSPKVPEGNTLMALTGVYVTEFMVVTNSTPPFQSFQVFQGNKNLTEKIWRNFTEYVFRKCKQDMRKKMKWLYHKRFLAAARAVGALAMPLLWR
ncbi:uncharacterized protein LOC142591287 isoform X2 [Dermacentor variabilis]|uniref:uncharacterized protein LOC142591287 isoform X2 n=1 Tax=Dermacentor variabilis TaxID=34621 RepID=UPI003F5AF954